ncbi:MAG TPA: hypothetical protein VFE56_05455, partial [Candidatus Binataceae bacterium]|nr:hypothetical protein [Candidatus Binataceae bacterium]
MDFYAIVLKYALFSSGQKVMPKTEGEGRPERLKKGAFARYLLVCCANAFVIGAFGAAVMGAAGDTIADRELGQIDLVHNGPNLVDGVGL